MESTTRRRSSTGEALFKDEGCRKIERTRATHSKIVDRAMNSQATDITAGKEDRRNDEGIGGEGEACAADGQQSLIVKLIENGIGECGKKDFFRRVQQ